MQEHKKKHVHPTLAWVAIAGCSLLGGLTSAMLYASAEGGTPPKPPEQHEPPSPCRQACYGAFGECNKTAGDNQESLTQCKTSGNECLAKCEQEKPKPPAPPMPPPSPCRQACYSAFGECNKAAGENQESLTQCKAQGNECLAKCGPETIHPGEPPKPPTSECAQACASTRNDCAKTAGEDATVLKACNEAGSACMSKCQPKGDAVGNDAQKKYENAVQEARKHYMDGQKKLLDDFQRDLEKAWNAKNKK